MLRDPKDIGILVHNIRENFNTQDFVHGDEQIVWDCNDSFVFFDGFAGTDPNNAFGLFSEVRWVSDSRIAEDSILIKPFFVLCVNCLRGVCVGLLWVKLELHVRKWEK